MGTLDFPITYNDLIETGVPGCVPEASMKLHPGPLPIPAALRPVWHVALAAVARGGSAGPAEAPHRDLVDART